MGVFFFLCLITSEFNCLPNDSKGLIISVNMVCKKGNISENSYRIDLQNLLIPLLLDFFVANGFSILDLDKSDDVLTYKNEMYG